MEATRLVATQEATASVRPAATLVATARLEAVAATKGKKADSLTVVFSFEI